jgi:hypothetical protein
MACVFLGALGLVTDLCLDLIPSVVSFRNYNIFEAYMKLVITKLAENVLTIFDGCILIRMDVCLAMDFGA